MSRIDELIKKFCPEGVKWVKLGDVCDVKRGVRVVRKDLLEVGTIPVYQNSLKPLGYFHTSNQNKNTTYVIGAGNAGEIGFSNVDFWSADDCYVLINNENFNSKYIYYFLLQNQAFLKSKVRKGSVPRLAREVIENIKVPLPPLEVQQSIVDVLDKFEAMRNNLNAELEKRRKQYEHYREKLLTFGDDVKRVKLDCVISNLRTGLNPRVHFKLNTVDATGYYVTVRELKGFDVVFDEKTDKINKTAIERINERSVLQVGDILFSGTGTIGRTALIKKQPTNWNIKEGVYALTPIKEKVLSRYLIFLFHTQYFMGLIDLKAGGSTVKSIPMSEFKNLTIPLPSLEVQNSIVAKLDKFEALISNIERELELRTKQYEYYREKLLTF